jgi:molybdate transport system substrate-binding protein
MSLSFAARHPRQGVLFGLIHRLGNLLGNWRLRQDLGSDLGSLDDRLLDDVGLSREHLLWQTVWRHPMYVETRPAFRASIRSNIPGRMLALAAAVTTLTIAAAEAPLHAAEIRLLSAASIQEVFKQTIGDFERSSGHKVILHYGTMGAITDWMRGGEQADLVISSLQSISALVKEGKIEPASQATIAKVGVGMVVPSGNPVPTVASAEDLKRALLAAKTIIYADPSRGGAAGIHIARVIQDLGIAEQLKPKIKFGAGGDITEVTLTQGDGAFGMTQVSEIVGKPGAVFVGAFPEQIQNYTVFAIGRPAGAQPSDAVTGFVDFLRSPAAEAAMNAKGMQANWLAGTPTARQGQ